MLKGKGAHPTRKNAMVTPHPGFLENFFPLYIFPFVRFLGEAFWSCFFKPLPLGRQVRKTSRESVVKEAARDRGAFGGTELVT